MHWWMWPDTPMVYRFPTGGRMKLYAKHSFTECIWPGVDRYEPDVQVALAKLLRRGDTFIDCGANVGYFSIMASDLVGPSGQVVSIEANPRTYELLKGNLALNGNRMPIHCALTSKSGEVDIFVSDAGDVYSSLRTGGLVQGDTVRSHKVPAKTLDEVLEQLALERVDVVKVDIEGGELDVLRSAPQTMSKFRPTWIMEYGTNTWPAFGATPQELLEILAERQYVVRQFNPRTAHLYTPDESIWQSHYANLILVPAERAD
jgi:FkbM family methyltransferase